MTEGKRPRRVAEAVRKHVADALNRELYDPRLVGLIVTRVEVGVDLSLARVYLKSMVGVDEAAEREVEKAANRAAPILRRGLAARLDVKRLPELLFFYDSSQKSLDRVQELLGEIELENGARPKE
jgi:ribosome-binding factor A